MKIHSSEKLKKLKKLRKKGYSINELVRELSIPKTTVWHHVHNIKIAPKYISLLRSKIGGSHQKKREKFRKCQNFCKGNIKIAP